MQRLERIVANRGAGSRSDVRQLLRQGRVTIDGKVVRAGTFRSTLQGLRVDGEAVEGVPLLALYHKPVGVHSTMKDTHGRDSLADLSEDSPFLKSMHPVGRLDADTSGLLLFSSDGQLTNHLLSPNNAIEREYEAIVVGTVDENGLKTSLQEGVETTDGTFPATLLEVQHLDKKYDVVSTSAIAADAEIDADVDAAADGNESVSVSYVRLTVCEGKYRMVRRILHNAGHSVVNLHRICYGDITLGDVPKGGVLPCSDQVATWAHALLKK